ncbi:MAG: Nif3-like dinuclear metal center hexameric protein [Holophagales bacterium]|nr:Nif3-like dinuclear metal center hexameric protein [Holophagales bacterium]
MHRDELVAFLDHFLDAANGDDYCPNGLQVEGREDVHRVITAVSACEELFRIARERRADAVLVHHGVFWHGMPLPLTGIQHRRIRQLVLGELNLLAYHLPLDRHAEVGNNALAARDFGLVELTPFAPHRGLPTGFSGRFPEPIAARELLRRCEEVYGQAPLCFAHGPDPVRNLGIVSGGAQKDFYSAIAEGLDAFVTGEVSEWVMNVARESRTHYLAAGHYATERCGIRRLGELVAERFDLEVEFVDIPNPV